MSNTQAISIQIQRKDQDFLSAVKAEPDIEFIELETSSFDGQSEILTLVVTLTPVVIGLIGRIISQQLKARRYVKVVYQGLQIQGLSDASATRLIESLIEKKP